MMQAFRLNLWRRRAPRAPLSDSVWSATIGGLTPLSHLDSAGLRLLREQTERFLAQKTFDTKGDLEPDPALCALIAVQACLPVLHLGLDCYRDWRTVIVYPEGFDTQHEVADEAGVVHSVTEARAGEAWERGPLVLSWHDVLSRGEGFNVIVHECAHKLDMLNGAVNGFPPLHADMDAKLWSRIWGRAYDDFCARIDAGEETDLDPYAADDPGEFFAVVSETFFELPQLLHRGYPALYRQLRQFYRQDPLARARR